MTQEAMATPVAVPWGKNLALFLATIGSVFLTGVVQFSEATPDKALGWFAQVFWILRHASAHDVIAGAQFVGTVLSILTAHELGHYIAARVHKVEASLPFFIPMPLVSPFGTMGAVIRMRGHIPTRRALLDIGAAGPLAGMVFAIPLYAWGVHHSHVAPLVTGGDDAFQLGESVLVHALDHFFAPAVTDETTVVYSPVAFGAWGGFFITMINMFPVGQLDGGHVAYALFGPRQNRFAQQIHRAMLAFFFVIVVGHLGRDVAAQRPLDVVHLGRYIGNAFSWLVWFQLLAILGTVSSRASARDDDPDPPGTLTVRVRVIITVGLGALASLARTHGTWSLVGGFLAALALLVAMEIRGGVLRRHDLLDHPSTGAEPLGPGRKAVAILTLLVFAALFMPEPFSL